MEKNPIIRIKNLQKRFEEKHILNGIDLEIYKGEILYIIGQSGSGKSVLLKHIVGLMYPNSGSILIEGENLFEMDQRRLVEVRSKFGVLFQMVALFDSLNVKENIAFGLRRLKKYDEDTISKIVSEKLRLVGLSGIENARPADLSGGMQKRVGLARAIALDPEIVLYDEPTTGVDPILASAVDDLIKKLNDELGVTSIVISHDIDSVFRTAQRVAMLHNGDFILVGTPREFEKSDNPVIYQFISGKAEGPIPIL